MSIRTVNFIGSCLSLDEHPTFREAIIKQFSDPDYDWNNFIWTCSNHLVLPAIYLKFRDHNLLFCIPDVLVNHLKEIYELNLARNKQILLQMKEITATLNQNDISPIYLKGTGNLIDGIYSDIGERIIGDIDFWVPENVFLKSAEIFKAKGYISSSPFCMLFGKYKHHHYPPLLKDNAEAYIEIHWLPIAIKYANHLSNDLVQKNAKTVSDYPGCLVLSDDHKVILNFIHSQLVNSGNSLGIISLRDVYDVYCFSKRTDLTNILSQILSQKKAVAYFTMAQRLLGLPVIFKQTWASKVLLWKHNLNQSSRLFVASYKFALLIWGIICGYTNQIEEALTCKEARQLLFKKLGDRKWYIQHFRLIIKHIFG